MKSNKSIIALTLAALCICSINVYAKKPPKGNNERKPRIERPQYRHHNRHGNNKHCLATGTDTCRLQITPDTCRANRVNFCGQPPHHRSPNGHKLSSTLKKALKGIELTESQKDSVKSVSRSIRQSYRQSERNLRAKMRAAEMARMKQILTPEQYTIYEQNMARINAPKPPKDFKPSKDGQRVPDCGNQCPPPPCTDPTLCNTQCEKPDNYLPQCQPQLKD